MTKTALKPHEEKKINYALKAFLWGMIISGILIVPSMISDKGIFMYYGDYNVQVIPFYQLMSDAIKSGNTSWSWYTDLGTSFVGGYSFYNLGSPFFWMLVPFPSRWIPYLMGPLTIFKFGCCTLTAYTFLQRYTKDKNNAVIGALLYAFSGFAVYGMVFHFIDPMVFFPLLLTTMDDFIYEKKRGRFALAVAVCAIVNYYFFVAEVVFCLIYWFVRLLTKNYRMNSRQIIELIFEAVLGLGISMFILLPSLYHMLGNNRINTSNMNGWSYWIYENAYQYAEIFVSLFMPPEYAPADIYVPLFKSDWSSITAYIPLFNMTGVFAVIFNKHRNKWIKVFYAVCCVFMLIPILNSSFQMFTETGYLRWFFMLTLVMSMGSVMALEDPSTKWKKSIISTLVISVVLILIIGFTPLNESTDTDTLKLLGIYKSGDLFWVNAGICITNIAICGLFVSLYKNNKKAFKKYVSYIVSCSILLMLLPQFMYGKTMGYHLTNIVGKGLLDIRDTIQIDDIQDWRTDTVSDYNYDINPYDEDHVESYDLAQLNEMNSALVDSILYSKEKMSVTDTAPPNDNLNIFMQSPGIESFHSTINSSILNFMYGCFGMERLTLTSWRLGVYGIRSLFSVKYLINQSDSPLKLELEDGSLILPGWKYLETQNGFDIYENEYVLPMGFAYDHYLLESDLHEIPQKYVHIALLDTLIVSDPMDALMCQKSGMEMADPYAYEYTEEEYYKFCKDRMKLACTDFKRDNKGFEATFTSDERERYVFFSVPYDMGWKATVNGEKVDIMTVDCGLMAVKVPANQTSLIRFDYHTPGKLYGLFVAGLCIFLLVLYLAAMKIQSSQDEEKESSDDDNNQNEEKEYSVFDIIKETEAQNMMQVYKRIPVVIESGEGSVAYDIDKKKYIDFTSGIGVNALGFANGAWIDAVSGQLDLAAHVSNVYYNTTQIQLAELLCIKTGLNKVFFANSGAEANECAIKIARKYGSDKYGEAHTEIVTLKDSFHGRTITTLSATGQEVFHKYFTPFTEGFSYAEANDIESLKNTVTENTCAVMIELVQGEGGVRPLDKEYVKALAQFCEERDILLIVDEIQTGIGRTGKLFCYENYDIKPDIITSAKALGGGLPLSACLCNEKLKDVMTIGSNGTTFGGNPAACAGAMKILDIVSDEAFLEDVTEKGEYIKQRLEQMDGVKEVRGLGLMIGIVLEKDNAAEIQEKCAGNGLLVLTAKKLLRLLPPLNIDYEDINEGLEILEKTLYEEPAEEQSKKQSEEQSNENN